MCPRAADRPCVELVKTVHLEDCLETAYRMAQTVREPKPKAVNRPEKGSAMDMVFAWLDTREARPLESKAYALLNDNGRPVKADVTDAFRSNV